MSRGQTTESVTTAPVGFWGVEHRAAKGFSGSTHRTCPPEETFERIQPLLEVAGITRLADVTGLDRIGIPCVLAIRPNAPTLSNTSGKGFTTAAAAVSAAMEGIELHFAEVYEPGRGTDGQLDGEAGLGHGCKVTASFNELAAEGLICPVEDLQLARHNVFHPDQPEVWVIGFDLIGQRPSAVPLKSVTMAPARPSAGPKYNFQGGSSGLASGNVFLEAVCSGLAEVIERDAVTCTKLRRGGAVQWGPAIDLESLELDMVAELRGRLRWAGVQPELFDVTVDTRVPTYAAWIVDEKLPSIGDFWGYGAHLHPEVAMIRALTEAVQSRAVYITGSRDDIFALELRRLRRVGQQRVTTPPPILEHEVRPTPQSLAAQTFEEDCQALLDGVRRASLPNAVVVDLAPPDAAASVVRVIVPGLEGYSVPNYWLPGRRGRAAMAQWEHARRGDGSP